MGGAQRGDMPATEEECPEQWGMDEHLGSREGIRLSLAGCTTHQCS